MRKTLLAVGIGVVIALPFATLAAEDPAAPISTSNFLLQEDAKLRTGTVVPVPTLRPNIESEAQSQGAAGGGGGGGQDSQLAQQIIGQAMDAVIKSLLGGAMGAGAGEIVPICPGQKKGTPCSPVSIGGQIVTSVCDGAGKCIGTGFTPFGGGASQAPSGLGAIGQIVQGIAQNLLQKLMQGDGGGGGGGGGVQSASYTSSGYGINSASTIYDSFQSSTAGFGTGNSVADILARMNADSQGTSNTTLSETITVGGSQSTKINTDVQTTKINTDARTAISDIASGKTSGGGENKTSFGAIGTENSEGETQEGLIGRLCSSRPWDRSFISSIVPSSFFDGLCARIGYTDEFDEVGSSELSFNDTEAGAFDTIPAEEGEPEPTSDLARYGRGISCSPEVVRVGNPVSLRFSCGNGQLAGTAGFRIANASVVSAQVTPQETTVYGVLCSDNFQSVCTVRVIDPQVAIWAEPSSVRLGSRTTIYWNTRDIDTCTVIGPDFSQAGAYGGAGTVVIGKTETFTAVCQAPDGSEITEEVNVSIAL